LNLLPRDAARPAGAGGSVRLADRRSLFRKEKSMSPTTGRSFVSLLVGLVLAVPVLGAEDLPPGVIRRIGTSRFRHEGYLCTAAYPADGSFLATVGTDNYLRLWDPDCGKPIRKLRLDHERRASALALTRDGKLAALGIPGTKVVLMETATGKVTASFEQSTRGGNMHLAFSPDGKLLAAGCDYGLDLWDVKTGKEIELTRADISSVNAVAFSPDGKKLAVGVGYRESVIVWDTTTGRKLLSLPASAVLSYGVAFSPDGKTLASGGYDRTVRLWDADNGKELWTVRFPSKQALVYTVAFSPDGKQLAAGTHGDGLYLMRASDGKLIHHLGERANATSEAVFAPDGKTLTSWGGWQTLRRWEVSTGKEIEGGGFPSMAHVLAFGPDGRTLATAPDAFAEAWLMDAVADQPPRRIEARELPSPSRLAFSRDGRSVAGVCGTVIQLWDAATGRPTHKLAESEQGFTNLAFAPDGKSLVTTEAGENEKLFNPAADPKKLAESAIRTWDLQTGKAVHRFDVPRSTGSLSFARLTLSADGSIVASQCFEDKVVRLWSARGKPVGEIATGEDPWRHLVLSADGRSLAAGTEDKAVMVWETATGKLRRRLPVGRPLSFSADGSWLLVQNEGNPRLMLHDLSTGEMALQAPAFTRNLTPVAFAPDGRLLAIAQEDTTILIYDLAALAKKRAALDLSDRELNARWVDLADGNAEQADSAIWDLTRSPEKTVALLKTKLSLAKPGEWKTIDQLLADLDHDSLERRDAASKELAARLAEARPALQELLDRTQSPEVKRRVQLLLARKADSRYSPEDVQRLRAIEVLEHIGSTEARRLLEALAKGAEEAPLTLDARAALRRLESRTVTSPR
jgi:WD40 repeat protein